MMEVVEYIALLSNLDEQNGCNKLRRASWSLSANWSQGLLHVLLFAKMVMEIKCSKVGANVNEVAATHNVHTEKIEFT